jgi:hypothetical protein
VQSVLFARTPLQQTTCVFLSNVGTELIQIEPLSTELNPMFVPCSNIQWALHLQTHVCVYVLRISIAKLTGGVDRHAGTQSFKTHLGSVQQRLLCQQLRRAMRAVLPPEAGRSLGAVATWRHC